MLDYWSTIESNSLTISQILLRRSLLEPLESPICLAISRLPRPHVIASVQLVSVSIIPSTTSSSSSYVALHGLRITTCLRQRIGVTIGQNHNVQSPFSVIIVQHVNNVDISTIVQWRRSVAQKL